MRRRKNKSNLSQSEKLNFYNFYLYQAAFSGFTENVKFFINARANVNWQFDKDFPTPDFNLFQTTPLSPIPVCTSMSDEQGSTPLYIAAKHGYPDIVQLLIHHGAKTTIVNSENANCLHAAILSLNSKIIELITNSYSDFTQLDHPCQLVGETLFGMLMEHLGVRRSHFCSKQLLEYLSYEDVQTNSNYQDCIIIIENFLNNNCNFYKLDDDKYFPLSAQQTLFYKAIIRGNTQQVSELISHVDINTQIDHGLTALHLAVIICPREEILQLLLTHPQILLKNDRHGLITLRCYIR